MRKLALFFACFMLPAVCVAQNTQKLVCPQTPERKAKFIPLPCVVQEVQAVLVAAQQQLTEKKIAFQLKTAEFDFQSTTSNTGDLGVSSIVTADYNKEKGVSQEVDFTYQVPDRATVSSFFNKGLHASSAEAARVLVMKNLSTQEVTAPQMAGGDFFGFIKGIFDFFTRSTATTPAQVQKILPVAIVQAAEALQDAQVITPASGTILPIDNYVVTLSFTVSGTFTVGVDASSLIVVSPTIKYIHETSNVQTIKLTFTNPNS